MTFDGAGNLDGQLISGAYAAAPRAAVRAAAVVEYRCDKGCLLLHVWKSPVGVLFYVPRFRLSPIRAETDSTPEARRKRTSDGHRRWEARGGILDEMRSWGASIGLTLQCDHVKHYRPAPEILGDADRATPGKPTRRTFP